MTHVEGLICLDIIGPGGFADPNSPHHPPSRLCAVAAHPQAYEEAFGWAKTVAGLRKLRYRGLPKVHWQLTLAMAAYDLVRLPRLLAQPAR